MKRMHEVWWRTAGFLLLGASLSTGCATSRSAAEPEPPPLANPVPPPRLLPPLAGGPIEAVTLPPNPEAERPAQAPRRREPARPDASARQDPRPADLPKVEPGPEPPRAAEEPSALAPVLQLSPADESGATEPAIRGQLTRATLDLSRVDYGALSPDAKAQYDTAKRFMVLADQAIKERNFVFARTLADKAAVIAGVLLSR